MITMRFLCKYQLLTAGILIGMLAVGSVYGDPPHTAQQESDSTLVDVPLFDQEKKITYYSAERGLLISERSEQDSWQIMWWNVENLFHPDVDSLNPDREFTPDGMRRWTYRRYRAKVAQIAQVVANAGGWNGVDVVGLCEVEDSACVADICRALGNGYRAVHYDSPDPRGIDVVLLYRSTCTCFVATPSPSASPTGNRRETYSMPDWSCLSATPSIFCSATCRPCAGDMVHPQLAAQKYKQQFNTLSTRC